MTLRIEAKPGQYCTLHEGSSETHKTIVLSLPELLLTSNTKSKDPERPNDLKPRRKMDPDVEHDMMPSQLSASASPFLALPLELRNSIYEYVLDWPDLCHSYRRTQFDEILYEPEISKASPLCVVPIPLVGEMRTPSLLLVNHQVTSEALVILHRKPLVLSETPPHVPQLAKPMDITEFISETTLQLVPRVVLQMDLSYNGGLPDRARAWLKTVETLLDVWCIENSLELLEVRGRYAPPSRALGWTFGQAAHHRNVMGLLSRVWAL